MLDDTIAAIATPPGEGGIAIVRVSGPDAIRMVDRIYRPVPGGRTLAARPGYSLGLGWIVDANGDKVDEVLVSLMRAPKSYTAEDVVEINCHGGQLPARRCLEETLKQGARLAEPGEFTRRAFLNGRLDITQAEAVLDVIRAKTAKGMQIALRQLEGGLGQRLRQLEERLVRVNAMVEASIDFPEEVGDIDVTEATGELELVAREVARILRASQRGRIYRQGIKVVIAGKPNVGKSSLLNAVLREKKAIVTDIPGTTRDVVEDYINIRGIPIRLMDTAGMRDTEDLVEKIGVEKSKEALAEADLVIIVLDVTSGITAEDREIAAMCEGKKTIVLVNKEDLEARHVSPGELAELFPDTPIIHGSVKEEIGLEELEDTVEAMIVGEGIRVDDMEIMVNLRHEQALRRVYQHVQAARKGLQEGVTLDCLAVDVWGALEALGEVSGKTLREDVIDRIFHDFCIGK